MIPNYNLKREDYKDKSNILILYLSLEAMLQDLEGVKNPNLLGETCFLYFDDQSHIMSFKQFISSKNKWLKSETKINKHAKNLS